MNFKSIINNLLRYFFITFHLFLAAFLIYALFYIRFLPRVSSDLWQDLTKSQLFFILFTISCILLNIYNTVQIIGFIKKKEHAPWMEKILQPFYVFLKYIIHVFVHFYDFIWVILEKISGTLFNESCLHYFTFLPLARSFTNPKHSPYYFSFLLGLKLLPIIVFVLALAYDVFFCQRFDYTFRCIPFLLIPLLEPIFLFILRDYHKTHMFALDTYVIFVPVPETEQFDCFLRGKEEDLPYGAKNFDDFIDNHFFPVDQIPVTIKKYEAWKSEKFPTYYIQLSLQVLRLSVYIYVLVYGIM